MSADSATTGSRRLEQRRDDFALTEGLRAVELVAHLAARVQPQGVKDGCLHVGGKDSPGAIIASCEPEIVIQPWTEDASAAAKAKGAAQIYFTSLDSMHAYAQSVVNRAPEWRGSGGKATRLDKLLRAKILPISFGFPFGLSVVIPPNIPLPAKIVMRVLPPIDIVAEFGENPDVDEVDGHVRHVMQRALDELAEERRLPVFG